MSEAKSVSSVQSVTIPLDVAVMVERAFLPSNPNKLRRGLPELKTAAHAFKEAVHKAEQRIALMRDCPYCQSGVACARHPK